MGRGGGGLTIDCSPPVKGPASPAMGSTIRFTSRPCLDCGMVLDGVGIALRLTRKIWVEDAEGTALALEMRVASAAAAVRVLMVDSMVGDGWFRGRVRFFDGFFRLVGVEGDVEGLVCSGSS